ncbi:CrcB family protein [Corynebacterium imitans]|uniref:CrcB family protein n=1 Tax=Corynebacterium imitans TaxID=156978 RepID=UPI001EF3C2DF|nr:CrcB family protein [Corynebacterium imitans]MCG7278361.1 CrcB family protein [Corynebacterium imitans]
MQGNTFREALLVGLGAALGALLRAALDGLSYLLLLFGVFADSAVAVTLGINAIGAFAMGYFKPGVFLGTGFLGGFTTFSAMAVAAVHGSAIFALGLVITSFIVCVGAWLLADAVSPRPYRNQTRN